MINYHNQILYNSFTIFAESHYIIVPKETNLMQQYSTLIIFNYNSDGYIFELVVKSRKIGGVMFRKSFLLFLMLFILTGYSHSQSSGFGIGIMIGEPTGINLKNWMSESAAIDAGIAWGFGRKGAFHVHADYLIHEYNLININHGRLPIYYGVGGRILLSSDSEVGIRGVVGLDYMFENAPVDIFLEIVPIFDLVPATELSFNAGIGVRYFL